MGPQYCSPPLVGSMHLSESLPRNSCLRATGLVNLEIAESGTCGECGNEVFGQAQYSQAPSTLAKKLLWS
jgi:hypothetical protein